MASVASQLIQEVTAHAQSDSFEGAREICADGTYFPNNLRIIQKFSSEKPTAILLNCHFSGGWVKSLLRNWFSSSDDGVIGLPPGRLESIEARSQESRRGIAQSVK